MKRNTHGRHGKGKMPMSKALITFIMLISIVVTGLVSYRFFRSGAYNLSNLLTIACLVSMVCCVYVLTNKRSLQR